MKKIAVSYLGVKSIPKAILMIDKTDADYVHVDVMDGKYTDYKTVGFNEMTIGKYTQKRLDVHFMVRKPHKMVDYYALLDAYCMTFHIDIKSRLKFPHSGGNECRLFCEIYSLFTNSNFKI